MKTNLKTFACGLILATALTPLVSCNSDDEYEYVLPGSATVRSFSLASNDKVLNNLDSVFFSINLYTGEIFNADSLPYGTRTKALVPVILTDGAQIIELSVPRPNNVDTLYNYLENTSDTIDFSNGPVKMRIVSLDGKTERNYSIKINVHTVPTDTLVWSRLDKGNLPSLFGSVNEQHTAMSPDGQFFCLTRYQSEYSLCTTTDPAGVWNGIKTPINFDADINSLTATTQALYILDKSGNLYTSADKGASWTATGEKVTYLLGAYQGTLLATDYDNSVWQVLEYPCGIRREVPEGFPVKNTSTAVTVSYEMSLRPQFIIVGGRTSDDKLTGDTWGFDGSGWANITKRPLAEPLENLSLVPYFDVKPDTASWRVSKTTTVLFAMHGNSANGVPNDTLYMSADFGMHWDKAPNYLQVSKTVIPSRTKAQAYPHTNTVSQAKAPAKLLKGLGIVPEWTELGVGTNKLRYNAPSRITSPVTEWDVPYIYLFGGVNVDGVTYNTVFRGAITALTFKPVQ